MCAPAARDNLLSCGVLAANESCQIGLDSLGGLQKLAPSFERAGRSLAGSADAFRSVELRNFDLGQLPPGTQPVGNVPAEVLRVLGWKDGPGRPWRVSAVGCSRGQRRQAVAIKRNGHRRPAK